MRYLWKNNLKRFGINRFLNSIYVKFKKKISNFLQKIHECSSTLNHCLSTLGTWAVLSTWAILTLKLYISLERPLFLLAFTKKKTFCWFKILFLFIPLKSLTCHKSNLFKRTYDFLVEWTTTLDLQWRVSHYLKRLICLNINRNKIANIQTRLIVLTISFFENFVTKHHYINPPELS